jgi:U3 small nucleolar RNA-associated protein 19
MGSTKRARPKAARPSLEQLVDELNAEPAKANNLPRIIASLAAEGEEVRWNAVDWGAFGAAPPAAASRRRSPPPLTARPPPPQALPAIRGLRLFFIDRFERQPLRELAAGAPPAAEGKGKGGDSAAAAAVAPPPEALYAAWLLRQYDAYVAALLGLLAGGAPPRVQLAALGAALECARGESPGALAAPLAARAVAAAVAAPAAAPEALAALAGRYAGYADVRHAALRALARLCARRAGGADAGADAGDSDSDGGAGDSDDDAPAGGELSTPDLARNAFDLLAALTAAELEAAAGGDAALASWCGAAEAGAVAPAAGGGETARQRKRRRAEEEEVLAAAAASDANPASARPAPPARAAWASARARRRAASDAWLALLRLPLPDDVYRKVLARLHDLVIPALTEPLRLSDWLTHSLDRGGLTGMLALHGIFILVTRHGLEYPKFYARLYALLTPEAFRARGRARFFQVGVAVYYFCLFCIILFFSAALV